MYFTHFDANGKAQKIYDPFGNVYERTGDSEADPSGQSFLSRILASIAEFNANIISVFSALFSRIISFFGSFGGLK